MSSTKEYSSNVVRVLHPHPNNNNINDWDEQHYESKTTSRNILDSTTDHQLASTNFIRQAQSNYSQRSNYSTKSNREYIDDELLQHSIPPQQQQQQQQQHHKVITTKKTSNYNTSGGNVDYLDELLDDLKNERTNNDVNDYTTSYKYNSSSNIPESSNLNKRTEYYDSKVHRTGGGSNIIHHDVYNNAKSLSSGNLIEHNPSTGQTIKRTEHIEVLPGGSKVQRTKHIEVLNSNSLETVPLLPHSSTSNETTLKRDVVVQNTADHLRELPIDPTLAGDLLPLPGTKVTTTVRTYTYEVPSVITKTNVLYHDDIRPDPTVINTSTINKNYTSEKITNLNDNYTSTDVRILNNSAPSPNDYTPVGALSPHHVHEPIGHGPGGPIDGGPGPKRTYYYKHEVHNTKNTINQPAPLPMQPQQPPHPHLHQQPPYVNEYHITKNTTNTTTNRYPPNNEPLPPTSLRPISPESISPNPSPHVSHHTYITNTTTTNDYTDGPRPRNLGPYDGPNRPPYDGSNRPPYDGPGRPYDSSPTPHSPGEPNVTYIRSHEKHTSSTMPFPVNDSPFPVEGGVQPPKKLDDLMASFDKNGDNPDSDDIRRKREIDTSIANTDNKVRVPSRNQAGPPVYYPKNSELTLRSKEGGGGAWRAQGGYAAGASGYEYQSESSSKTKSKSGAAVVPVCLPLCCAMPCVIM